jgi:hypothetical protein
MRALAAGVDAYTFRFDPALAADAEADFDQYRSHAEAAGCWQDLFRAGTAVAREDAVGEARFHTRSYGNHPLLWVSRSDRAGHARFERFFAALDISGWVRQHLGIDHDPLLYCGFFVVCETIVLPTWHRDWPAGAKAMTLICPLRELDPAHGGLLYRVEDKVGVYRYCPGEGVIFGHDFHHATQPFRRAASPRVLLSITMGSASLFDWPLIRGPVCGQSAWAMCPTLGWVPVSTAAALA